MVGVDQPTKALSMHNTKVTFILKAVIFFKKIGAKLLHLYIQCAYIVRPKYQNAPSKAAVGADQPMEALL